MDVIQLRSEAEQALGELLTDDQWHILEDVGCVYDLECEITQSPSALAQFAERVRNIRKAFGGLNLVRRERQIRPTSMSERFERREAAVAALLAAQAAELEVVQVFRQEVLSGSRLRWEDVEAWLAAQAQEAEADPFTFLITCPSMSLDELHRLVGGIPQEDGGVLVRASEYPPRTEEQRSRLRAIANQLVIEPAFRSDRPNRLFNTLIRHYNRQAVRTLRCYVPDLDTGGVREVSHETGTTGVLERLRQLSQDMATRYGWDAADAAYFILTGLPPRIALIAEQLHIDELIPAHSRIILTIDPTIAPVDVKNYYRHVRKQVLGRRSRTLSDKHLGLARFAALRPRGESGTKRMIAWNEQCSNEHPTWKYRHASNFIRDCHRAQQRLLHPDIRRPRGEKPLMRAPGGSERQLQ